MDSWKIVSKIASAFGIIFIIFAVFASFISYEDLSVRYVSTPPAGFMQVSIVEAMMPFLLYAVLSFAVSATINRVHREVDVKENLPAQAEMPATETGPEENKQ